MSNTSCDSSMVGFIGTLRSALSEIGEISDGLSLIAVMLPSVLSLISDELGVNRYSCSVLSLVSGSK